MIPSTYTTSIDRFLALEAQKAKDHHITFEPSADEKVLYANRLCSGFFESRWPLGSNNPTPYLTFGMGKPVDLWLPIAVHETSHMDQHIESSPYWMNPDDYALLDRWLEGRDVPQINAIIDQVILMEADCEIRTIEKIKQYQLPISTEYYAQRANAYLYFHHWMKENRQWCKKAPYEIKAILENMPTTIGTAESYLKPPEQSLIDLFRLTQVS